MIQCVFHVCVQICACTQASKIIPGLACVRVKVSDGDSAVGMVCIVTRCELECDVLECTGCSVCPTLLFLRSALCPHLMLHSTQLPLVAPQTFCSGLLCVSGCWRLFSFPISGTVVSTCSLFWNLNIWSIKAVGALLFSVLKRQ